MPGGLATDRARREHANREPRGDRECRELGQDQQGVDAVSSRRRNRCAGRAPPR